MDILNLNNKKIPMDIKSQIQAYVTKYNYNRAFRIQSCDNVKKDSKPFISNSIVVRNFSNKNLPKEKKKVHKESIEERKLILLNKHKHGMNYTDNISKIKEKEERIFQNLKLQLLTTRHRHLKSINTATPFSLKPVNKSKAKKLEQLSNNKTDGLQKKVYLDLKIIRSKSDFSSKNTLQRQILSPKSYINSNVFNKEMIQKKKEVKQVFIDLKRYEYQARSEVKKQSIIFIAKKLKNKHV